MHAMNNRPVSAILLTVALSLLCAMPALALAQPKSDDVRGELLYATHCSACHSAEIHWRKKKLATNWNSLVAQVRRWQANIGLLWSNEEIDDVSHYLNALHYGFSIPERKGYSQDNKLDHALRR